MKTLIDGKQVTSRSYYYLLDWNEVDEWDCIRLAFNKERLCDLNIIEYKQLFEYATKFDAENLIKKS